MRYIMLTLLTLGMMGSALAEHRVLDEAMTPKEKAEKYQPHRDAGHEALEAKRFDEAAREFQAAAYATAFAWVRARMLANAGFALARASRCEEAIVIYHEAWDVQDTAEEKGSGGDKWSKARQKTRADISWGLYDSACADE